MKRGHKRFVVPLLILAFLLLTNNAPSQVNVSTRGSVSIGHSRPFCVQCGVEGGCFICEGAQNGGLRCRTLGCFTCVLDGTCTNPGSPQAMASGVESSFKFAPNTIRELAAIHPRFAATLAGLNKAGGPTDNYSKIFWAPVDISTADVEYWLKPEQESATFFEQFNRKAKRANTKVKKGKLEPVIYEITFEEGPSSSLATLELRVIKGAPNDPPYSSMELKLAGSGKLGLDKKEWHVNSWRIQ